MNFDRDLLNWVLFFSGFTPERVQTAVQELNSWSIPHLEAELAEATLDNALAATLLVESIAHLVSIGVPQARLLRKLRDDRDVWPTYAEIRAAKILAAPFKQHAEFELEPRRASGKHADFKVRLICEDEPVFVEFKAIGLSDAEASFCARMGPQMRDLLPPKGFTAFHGDLQTAPFTIRPDRRAEVASTAAAAVASLPDFPPYLTSVSVIAHHTEGGYMRRLILRLVKEVAAQIPEGERGWAAFFWTNGVAARDILREIRWNEVPDRVAGIVLVGDAVAFPSPNVHTYYLPLPRDMPADARSELLTALVLEDADGDRWQLCDVGLGWSYLEEDSGEWGPCDQLQLPARVVARPKGAANWSYQLPVSTGKEICVYREPATKRLTWTIRSVGSKPSPQAGQP